MILNSAEIKLMFAEFNFATDHKLNFADFKMIIDNWYDNQCRSPLNVVRDDGSLEKYSTSKTLN